MNQENPQNTNQQTQSYGTVTVLEEHPRFVEYQRAGFPKGKTLTGIQQWIDEVDLNSTKSAGAAGSQKSSEMSTRPAPKDVSKGSSKESSQRVSDVQRKNEEDRLNT